MHSQAGTIDPEDLFRQAAAALDSGAACLIDASPDSLDSAERHLVEASAALRRLCDLPEGARAGSARSAADLRVKVRRVGELLRHARAFHQGLGQTVSADGPGYTASGEPGLTGPRSSLSIQG